MLKIGGGWIYYHDTFVWRKLQSYGVTVKVGGAAAHPDPLVPTPIGYAYMWLAIPDIKKLAIAIAIAN